MSRDNALYRQIRASHPGKSVKFIRRTFVAKLAPTLLGDARATLASMLATATERVNIPATPIDVVCGLGAGDAFGGSLCYGLLHEWDLERIGRFASAAGALVSTRLTCADAMPTVNELKEMMGEAA
jgi:sugar/nucleoside kinase (ribokinase family)